jgi:hypothetical protein
MYTIFVIHDSEGTSFFNADFQNVDQALHGQKFSYPFLEEECQIKNFYFYLPWDLQNIQKRPIKPQHPETNILYYKTHNCLLMTNTPCSLQKHLKKNWCDDQNNPSFQIT